MFTLDYQFGGPRTQGYRAHAYPVCKFLRS